MAEEEIKEVVKEKPKEAARVEVQAEEKAGPSLFSPEGILMLTIAVALDLIGLIFFILSFVGIGIPLSWMLDLAGLVVIGGWMFFRTGRVVAPQRGTRTFGRLFKRLGFAFVGEAIPFFGDIAFCWTLLVYFELKD